MEDDLHEPEFTLWEKHPFLRLLRFVDVESSGLHDGSYPLQFGWSGLDLRTSAVLVKPEPEWTLELYDPESFSIHGISYEHAMAAGRDTTEVAHLLNSEFEGKVVISDSIGWDGAWTMMLSATTDVPIRFGYNDFGKIAESKNLAPAFDRWCIARYHRLLEAVDRFYPHTHKADEDALRLAALTRMCMDREWGEWLLDRAATHPQTSEPTGPHP